MMSHVVGMAGDRFGRFIKRYRVLYAPAGWVSRIVASSPSSSLIAFTLGPLRARLRGTMSASDVLWVLDALQGESLRVSLAGGWGVDALIGTQNRHHDDLDVVIDDYRDNEPKAQQALAELGFKLVGSQSRRTWMPDLAIFEDGAGHRVELVSVDWDRLAKAVGSSGSTRSEEDLTAEVFARGEDQRGRSALPVLAGAVALPHGIPAQGDSPTRRRAPALQFRSAFLLVG